MMHLTDDLSINVAAHSLLYFFAVHYNSVFRVHVQHHVFKTGCVQSETQVDTDFKLLFLFFPPPPPASEPPPQGSSSPAVSSATTT